MDNTKTLEGIIDTQAKTINSYNLIMMTLENEVAKLKEENEKLKEQIATQE